MINTKVTFSSQIQLLVIEIGKSLERIGQLPSKKPIVELRKKNQIKTIFSTTKIEGNKLSLSEVTALIEGKRIKGDKLQIREVQNTNQLYSMVDTLNPSSMQDFLIGHNVLMKGLIKTNGSIRKVNVGIESKGKIKVVFPDFAEVPRLIDGLFDYIENSNDSNIVKSCIIHYLIESVHPFEDGNGRIGRFWHTLYLSKEFEVFEHFYIESLIRKYQKEYYHALFKSQHSDDPTHIVELLLSIMLEALEAFRKQKFTSGLSKQQARFNMAYNQFKVKEFTRSNYVDLFGNISPSLATKDLAKMVDNGFIENIGYKNNSRYCFIRMPVLDS
jgi:Fic family protein